MQYLIDTDMCIYIARRKSPTLFDRFNSLSPGDLGMSVVTYCELLTGAYKSDRQKENLSVIHELVNLIPVQSLSAAVGPYYGRLRASLERRGLSIGPYDLLIAAHAASLGVTLLTNNKREFSRVPGLRVEAWV